jgi:tRNA (guanine-N7-)-methyltransferase
VQVPSSAPVAPRTYKLRRGRLGAASSDALTRLLPALGLRVDGRPLDLPALFGRTAPVVLEIGCGNGAATAALAAVDPAQDVLAVDVHTAGVAALLRRCEDAGLENVRVGVGDGLVVLRDMLAASSLDEVRVWFPDPWPKTRHHKRRLLTVASVALTADRLRPGGRLRVATDDAAYAAQVLQAVAACPLLEGGIAARPQDRPVTAFERRALEAGRAVTDVVAVRA